MASDTGFFLERRQRIDEAPQRPQRAWCLTVVRLEFRLPPAENTRIRLSNTSVEVQPPLGVSSGHPGSPIPACQSVPFTTHVDRLRPRFEGGRLPVAGTYSATRCGPMASTPATSITTSRPVQALA